jgi:hypothetical protein
MRCQHFEEDRTICLGNNRVVAAIKVAVVHGVVAPVAVAPVAVVVEPNLPILRKCSVVVRIVLNE